MHWGPSIQHMRLWGTFQIKTPQPINPSVDTETGDQIELMPRFLVLKVDTETGDQTELMPRFFFLISSSFFFGQGGIGD